MESHLKEEEMDGFDQNESHDFNDFENKIENEDDEETEDYEEDMKEVVEDVPLVHLAKKSARFMEKRCFRVESTSKIQVSETSTLASAFNYGKKKNMLEPVDTSTTKLKDLMKKRRAIESPEPTPQPEPETSEIKKEIITLEEESDQDEGPPETDERGVPLDPALQYPVYNPLQAAMRRVGIKKKYGRKWEEKDTELFYKLIQVTGVDFNLMHQFMPSRSVDEHRSKYRREYRLNYERMSQTLNSPAIMNDETLEEIKKKDAEQQEVRRENPTMQPWQVRLVKKREANKKKRLEAKLERNAAKTEASLQKKLEKKKERLEKQRQRAKVKAEIMAKNLEKEMKTAQKKAAELFVTEVSSEPRRRSARIEKIAENTAIDYEDCDV
ncbi:unnamed protein product [Caenorhabditis auriculariae]|uniref:Transcription factor TFIIIB component B'' Myb domain-containing protein n=1 Tax=Caenorhabditis auriculariae TaxID=2777116 RepID=A0A8S1HC63_9PELO|nr:unnamed protein product [Caenorhabditis auriculariae]